MRAMMAIGIVDRTNAGRRRWCRLERKAGPIAGQHAVQDIGVGDVVETNAGADDAADGEETEAKAEDVDEHDPGPEDGRADADEGDQHRAVVERRGAMRRGNDAGRDADDERDHQRGGTELDRGAEELTELTGDRLVGPDGVAEIEREGGLQEVGILDRQGPVETELLANARDLFTLPLSPAIAIAGSPGINWIMMNTAVMIPSSTGTARSKRRITYRVIVVP